jgi:hypothetical protein
VNNENRIYGTLTEQGFIRYGYMGVKKDGVVIAHKRKNETWFMVDDNDNFIDSVNKDSLKIYINESEIPSV